MLLYKREVVILLNIVLDFKSKHIIKGESKKAWNASRICVSSLSRGHANLLCIVPILIYVLPQQRKFDEYNFPSEGKVQLHAKKHFFFTINLFKYILKGFSIFRDSLQFFGDQENTYFMENLVMTACLCGWFINENKAQFLERAKNSST